MKRLPDNVHGAGVDSVYETEPFKKSVKSDAVIKIAAHLEAQGFGNFATAPFDGGVSVYKPYNLDYCARVNYYDARALTETEMTNLEAAIKAAPGVE